MRTEAKIASVKAAIGETIFNDYNEGVFTREEKSQNSEAMNQAMARKDCN